MQYGSQFNQFQPNIYQPSKAPSGANNSLAAQFSSSIPVNAANQKPAGSNIGFGNASYSNTNNLNGNGSHHKNPAFGLPAGVKPGFNLQAIRLALGTTGLEPEPPLLEELGINFAHVHNKTITVLNPFKAVDKHIMDDTDLAGPLIFCLAFGAFLLLAGKLQFGYVYGLSFVGAASMYMLLNLMSDYGVSFSQTVSVLGYCLLPMVILSVFNFILGLPGLIGYIFPLFSVFWCTYSASNIFTTVLSMSSQKALVGYPVGLFYSLFALLCVF